MGSLPWYIKMQYIGTMDKRVHYKMKIDKRYVFLKYMEFFLTEFIPERFFNWMK